MRRRSSWLRCLRSRRPFCQEPAWPTRILVGDGFTHVCEACVAEAVEIIAAKRAPQNSAA
jgi:hypothetical protein